MIDTDRLHDPQTARDVVAAILAEATDWPSDVFALASGLSDVDQPAAVEMLRDSLRRLDQHADTLGLIADMYRDPAGPKVPTTATKSRLSNVRRRVENMLTRYGVRDILTEAAGTARAVWQPDDLEDVLGDEMPKRVPTVLTRESDGMGMLYKGLSHIAVLPSFVGKSWVALVAAAQTINAGGDVLYLDYESDKQEVIGRLRLLGVDRTALRRHFAYSYSPRGFTLDNVGTVMAPALARAWDLVVIDGVTGAMGSLNLNINDATDVDRWQQAFPRAFAQRGAAVLMIGHRSKGTKAGGDPLGSQHWRAGIDGVQFEITAAQPVLPGEHGILEVRIFKDRPAVILGSQAGSKKKTANVVAALIHLDDTERNGTMGWRVTGPTGDEDREPSGTFFDPLMLESLRLAVAAHPGRSTRDLRARVTGANDAIAAHLMRLVELGEIVTERKGNGTYYHPAPPNTAPRTGPDIGPEAWEGTRQFAQPDPLNYLPPRLSVVDGGKR